MHAAKEQPAQINLKPAEVETEAYSTAQHSTAQHSTAQHSTAQHSTASGRAETHCSRQLTLLRPLIKI